MMSALRQVMPIVLIFCTLSVTNVYARVSCYPQADDALSSLKTWRDLRLWSHNYGGCKLDGFYYERLSEFVTASLAKHWDRLESLRQQINKEQAFEEFILRYINTTADEENLKIIIKNAKTRCPPGLRRLCTNIEKTAETALNEMPEEEFGFWVSYAQGIKVTCTSKLFAVASHTYNNRPTARVVKMGEGKTIYYGFNKRDVDCPLDHHNLRVSFITHEPAAKGWCGGAPGSHVRIWIDGQLLIENLFNNDCYESLSTVSFEEQADGALTFTICGHKKEPGYPVINDCFTFQQEDLRSFPKPLPELPISMFKDKGYLAIKEKK